jgi:SAM-dependent methyltransferase
VTPRAWLVALAERAFELNHSNIIELLRPGPYNRLCDLGCDDGVWTMEVAAAVGAREVYGIEIVHQQAVAARGRGVEAVIGDLNRPLPYADAVFDLIHANQVIEHIADLDTFLAEIHRVLRPGGTVLISTENASSWHNIGASVLGWQQFSLTNVSPRSGGIGNPFALHHGQSHGTSWTHKTVFNYRGLVDIHRLYGLDPVAIRGAGYHPLPPGAGRVDPRHAHLLAVKAIRTPDHRPGENAV